MALNLNKGGEENSKPSTEKKGLNLSKSVDTAKTGLNLNKEETVTKDSISSRIGAKEPSPKKKNPVMVILLAVLIAGGGIFWFLNRQTTTPEQISNINGDNTVSTPPANIGETASPDSTVNSQGQDKSINPSTITSSDNSISSPSESNVSASTNNVINSNNGETTNSSAIKNESTTKPEGSIEDKVNQVLRGDFGNGSERKQALGEAYNEIQSKVNELYRNKNN
jgi:hypothetical protein